MESQKCSQCCSEYREDNRLIQLPNCGHFICQKCSVQILNGTFQIVACNICSAFTKKQDINKNSNKERSSPKSQKLCMNNGAPLQQKCEEEQQQNILLDQKDQKMKKQEIGSDLCKMHHILMDIICVSDRERICPHCALFGNHKDHRFKRIQDFQKDTTQKINLFDQILTAKTQLYSWLQKNPQNLIDEYLNGNKIKIKQEISNKIQGFIGLLKKKQQKLLQEVESIYNQLSQFSKKQAYYKKKQTLITKIQKWEEDCASTKKKIMETPCLSKKIDYFFNSPLQIVLQGQYFIEELKNITVINNKNIQSKVKEIQVCIDTQMPQIIQRCIKVSKFSQNYCIVGMQFMQQQINDINPFIDCTSSQIHINSIDTVINNNNSLQMDITNLANSCKLLAPQLTKTIKKTINSKTQVKSIKSIEKKSPKTIINSTKKINLSPSKIFLGKNSRVSQFTKNKSPSKILNGGSLKVILPGTEVKVSEVKQPQKIYTDFSKNTLTDFFDISDCNLSSDKVIEYVHRARRIHKIRGLKLSSNHVNTTGFEKMIQFLKGVGNINLANNQITQTIFDILIKNKDRLDALKIINLSHNPISFDKKISSKIDELKKMGIIVIL